MAITTHTSLVSLRRLARPLMLAALAAAASTMLPGSTFLAQSPNPCAPPLGNPITCENALPGNPASEWDIPGAGDPTIQGFATAISVTPGQTVSFKVDTDASGYYIDIYRAGYYNGLGARRVGTVNPSVALPQDQPPCLHDPATGLIDCGNWAVSASWTVPANATSGVYFAKLNRLDRPTGSHMYFVVRNDSSQSDILFQTSDTTWQAYNDYGGNSLYVGQPAGRAYKVSYNRPYANRAGAYRRSFFWVDEYPMLRWLEANGYDVSYSSGVDTDARGAELLEHRVFLSVGHDEYWSGTQRANVEAARNAGVDLGFFSSNSIFWKTRWEPSIDGSNTPRRTLVTYKETHANDKIDPSSQWTGTWRDPRFSPPADGNRPENALKGSIFMVNCCQYDSLRVSSEEGKRRLWRNTELANLPAGSSRVFGTSLVGYEWDADIDNGFRPAGLIRLSSNTINVGSMLLDHGSTYGAGTATHSVTLYRHPSGALVFATGSLQWNWGLDAVHDDPDNRQAPVDLRVKQATLNILADMGVQPMTRRPELVAATPSSDLTPPTASITFPQPGATLAVNQPTSISGTSSDVGGQSSGIEVSVDGGGTWHPATGTTSWTYAWTPTNTGTANIRARAVDDSGNIQPTPATVTVTIGTGGGGGAPVVVSSSPAAGATGVWIGTPVTVTFSEPVQAGTVTSANVELRTSSNALVPATVTYDATAQRATLQPSNSLIFNATYTARVRGGSTGIKDLSGTSLANDFVWSFTTSQPPSCPCTLFEPTATPALVDSGDASAYELGIKFRADFNGFITGLRFYKAPGNTGTHVGNLWTEDGTLLATLTFEGETASGWQEATFSAPVAVQANTTYVASYHVPNGHYSFTSGFFANGPYARSPLVGQQSDAPGGNGNGVFKPGASGFPTSTYLDANYWVDVVFSATSGGPDVTPPSISARTPANGATGVPIGTNIDVTFSEPMNAQTITTTTVQLRNPSNQVVPGTLTYNASTRRATLDPTGALSPSTTYSVRVVGGSSGVADTAGNRMAADAVWSFSTASPLGCPCNIFDPTTVPPVADSGDGAAYELGVRFQAESNGSITGLRFYKSAANTGVHVANLWTDGGALLATATFANETATGWQQVSFTSPVPIAANTVYVASYHSPQGHYAFSANYFVNGVMRSPLSAPAASLGGNGVFKPGASGFPNQTNNAANYWVDVVFTSSGADTTAPAVSSTQPASNATGVPLSSAVSVQFNEPITPGTVSGSTFILRNAAQAQVAASVAYNAATRTATLTPTSPLAFGASYTARVVGGASGIKDLTGNPMAADHVWSFNTLTPPTCPCSIWGTSTTPATIDSGDGDAYELGVKFQASTAGAVTGVRFYKSAANTGTHTGKLWTSTGTLLASVTFTNESASGWQEAAFAQPVSITPGVTYVVSYWAPNGRYSVNGGYFNSGGVTNGPLRALASSESSNGVFLAGSSGFPTGSYGSANYWVDPIFEVTGVSDTTPPTVVGTSPVNGVTDADRDTDVVAQFSDAMQPSTLTSATVELRNASGTLVPATVSYKPFSRTVVLRPSSPLAFGATYSARIRGGAQGAANTSGFALASDITWTFGVKDSGCPCSIWDPTTTVPGIVDAGDGDAYELGVKVRPQMNGFIRGIRFYKSAANTGTHIANLWSSTGALLATATFTNETPSGWQEVTFATPVPVTAGATYVASYWAPNGHYSFNASYFSAGAVGSGPVIAPGNATTPNGVFNFGASAFPTGTYGAANYWVDVVFVPGS